MESDGLMDAPYFLENKDWYIEVEDDDNFCIHYELTELGKSIPKVVKSFEDYHAPIYDKDGNICDV